MFSAARDLRRSADARRAAVLLLIVTVFRLWFATRLELVGDEAYYWLWSRHLDYCYLDKGPMIAWAIRVGTLLFGPTVFGVRLFAVLAAAGTGWGIFQLGRRLFDDRTALWALVLALVAPLFAVGATLMTIDTLYVFFWTWAAVVFWHARATPRLLPWFVTGLLVGCGALSKYTALMELVSFAVFLAWQPDERRHLRRPGFWLMAAVAALFLLPAFCWNLQHGWPTATWLRQRGALDQSWRVRPLEALTFLGGQAGVISPLIFLALLVSIAWPRLPAPGSAREVRFTQALFLPLFLLYTILSLQRAGQANWAAACYIGGFILLARRAREAARLHLWARRVAGAALAVALLETAALHDTSWLHLPGGRDPLDRARGSRDLAASVAATAQAANARFVITNRYMTSALLSFYLPKHPKVYVLPSAQILNQLLVWPGYGQDHPSEDALWVSDLTPPPRVLRADFASVEPLGTHNATQDGRVIRRFYFYACRREARPADAVRRPDAAADTKPSPP
jgi:4-amino-4-deoxy-L-arabinose transferase-like glycosyltransferase